MVLIGIVMQTLSKNIKPRDFERHIHQLINKLDELIYTQPDKQKGSRLQKLESMFNQIKQGTMFNSEVFESAAVSAAILEERLINAQNNLRAEYDGWVENPRLKSPQAIVNTFEERVDRAMKAHMPVINSSYSTTSEVYAASLPLVSLFVQESFNLAATWMGKPGKMKDLKLGDPETTSTVSEEITKKYKAFSDGLHPDEATENTPLNKK
jgi:hypothetical protein